HRAPPRGRRRPPLLRGAAARRTTLQGDPRPRHPHRSPAGDPERGDRLGGGAAGEGADDPLNPKETAMTHPQPLLTILALVLIPAVAHAGNSGNAANHDDEAQTAAARMAQEHQHDKPVATPAAMQEPSHPVSAEEVTYAQVDGKPVHGYF